jgi:hypothetical protein
VGLRLSVGVAVFAAVLSGGALRAETVRVRYPEGLVHGFLTLRALDGAILAEGDQTQFVRDGRVTSRLVLTFRDGSVSDETTVFTQDREFRLVSDHLIQKGPSFKIPVDLTVEPRASRATVVYSDDGKTKTAAESLELPADLANGMVLTLIKNLDRHAPLTTVSMVLATPKPRLVNLAITPVGDEAFTVGKSSRKASRFLVHIELGGLAGVLAPILGKEPPDTHVWVLEGDAPAFVGSQGPLGIGTPPWRLELESPVAPKGTAAGR